MLALSHDSLKIDSTESLTSTAPDNYVLLYLEIMMQIMKSPKEQPQEWELRL
ncbi:17848_t:CDS:1, partial [Gigaspora margarita]